ncbi:hypothetical protein PoB_002085100 [Plakobranchus ocellatus]|uniref:Uncharacterized protein n=1 Tax=Plakobranchus ocellatus TaxID=259542 RepID=A0AAV3ZI87_9GAST|nr:hypothetical protein PoB_002085100 [Plakobranchus ocellatus]
MGVVMLLFKKKKRTALYPSPAPSFAQAKSEFALRGIAADDKKRNHDVPELVTCTTHRALSILTASMSASKYDPFSLPCTRLLKRSEQKGFNHDMRHLSKLDILAIPQIDDSSCEHREKFTQAVSSTSGHCTHDEWHSMVASIIKATQDRLPHLPRS